MRSRVKVHEGSSSEFGDRDAARLKKEDHLAFHAVRRNGDLPEAAGGRLDDLCDSFDRQGAQRELGGQTTKTASKRQVEAPVSPPHKRPPKRK